MRQRRGSRPRRRGEVVLRGPPARTSLAEQPDAPTSHVHAPPVRTRRRRNRARGCRPAAPARRPARARGDDCSPSGRASACSRPQGCPSGRRPAAVSSRDVRGDLRYAHGGYLAGPADKGRARARRCPRRGSTNRAMGAEFSRDVRRNRSALPSLARRVTNHPTLYRSYFGADGGTSFLAKILATM